MVSKKYILCFLAAYLVQCAVLVAQPTITLEELWRDRKFATAYVEGFNFLNDGKHYTRLEEGAIKQYDLTTGKWVKDLLQVSQLRSKNIRFSGELEGYQFSADERKILLTTEVEPIYRHSYKAHYFIWDTQSQTLQALFTDVKQLNATFSPDGSRVAFVSDNNVYIRNLATNEVRQVTEDGVINAIINGNCDWVYEEEFSSVSGEGMKAMVWSPDSKYLAFLRFDEREVKEFSMDYYVGEAYPTPYKFKYPKVGESNAVVTAHIYDIAADKVRPVSTQTIADSYIPRIQWATGEQLVVTHLNRLQNELTLFSATANTGKTTVLHRETNKYYIDINDAFTYLPNGDFIWLSEQDGYNHLYVYRPQAGSATLLTKGNYDVTAYYGVDKKRGIVYYQAAKDSPLTRHVYSIGLDGSNERQLTTQTGYNEAAFSSTFDYFVNTYSNINTPPQVAVYDTPSGKLLRTIEENERVKSRMAEYQTTPVEFFSFTTPEQVQLNGWWIKPKDFDAAKQYPVLMYQYSGPNSQEVLDQWIGSRYWWFQLLAQKGYIIACVDGRGTGARGEAFRKVTYKQLGKYEVIDQIATARYLASLPYVQKDRIGIFGWSYGGFMASNCILKGNDVFKAAIAVAPVTNWKWYDSVYTERYMQTEQLNPEGYRENSPVNFADRLQGNFLLVHGIADDNVHFQNTAELSNALITANKQFDTYNYPNCNHGINTGNATLHLYTKMTNFILEKL